MRGKPWATAGDAPGMMPRMSESVAVVVFVAVLAVGFWLWWLSLRAVYDTVSREHRPVAAYLILTLVFPPIGVAYAASHDMRARGRHGWAYAVLALLIY